MRPSLALSILVFFSFAGELRAAGVDLEVILSADVSRSIDDAEFELQRKGYAAALSDPRVLNAIHGRPGGVIGICFIEWSGEEEQQVVVDWTAIRDEEDAAVVATSILAARRSFMGRTSISSGIDFAVAQFAKSKWQVERRIIDISGGGTNNSGRSVTEGPRPGGVHRADHQRAGDHQRQPQPGIFRAQPPARWSAELLSTECDRRA